VLRFLAFFVATIFLAFSPPGARAGVGYLAYPAAAQQFGTLPINLRISLQLWLTAAGYWNAVPNADFSSRLFRAVERFQNENGFQSNGVFTKDQALRLAELAAPNLIMWGFRKVSHPSRSHSMWVPLGLGLMPEPNEFGIDYKDLNDHVEVNFLTVPDVSIADNYAAIAAQAESDGLVIHYKILKGNWYVISTTASTGIDSYARYHQDGANVTGFTLKWDNSKGDVHGDRMASIMSASLWADFTGAPFVDPPDFSKNSSNPTPPQPQPTTATVAPAPAPPTPPTTSQTVSTGTGFFVAFDGTVATAEHVIDGCSKIVARSDDGSVADAQLRVVDKANDLALLKVQKKPSKIGTLRVGIRLGETVEAFGFPHADLLSTSGNFTVGNVTAVSGMGDDSRDLQTSAPVQAGNSGGPLLDQFGNVVGLVDAKLNALKVAMADGDLPQNVNFAIKSEIVLAFLESNRVEAQLGSSSDKPLAPADIADKARAISVFIACQ
jgi:serine protease Do